MCKYMFAQRQNRLTTHFSERIPVVKRSMAVHVMFVSEECQSDQLYPPLVIISVMMMTIRRRWRWLLWTRSLLWRNNLLSKKNWNLQTKTKSITFLSVSSLTGVFERKQQSSRVSFPEPQIASGISRVLLDDLPFFNKMNETSSI